MMFQLPREWVLPFIHVPPGIESSFLADVVSVWDAVSAFIVKQMVQQKVSGS